MSIYKNGQKQFETLSLQLMMKMTCMLSSFFYKHHKKVRLRKFFDFLFNFFFNFLFFSLPLSLYFFLLLFISFFSLSFLTFFLNWETSYDFFLFFLILLVFSVLFFIFFYFLLFYYFNILLELRKVICYFSFFTGPIMTEVQFPSGPHFNAN